MKQFRLCSLSGPRGAAKFALRLVLAHRGNGMKEEEKGDVTSLFYLLHCGHERHATYSMNPLLRYASCGLRSLGVLLALITPSAHSDENRFFYVNNAQEAQAACRSRERVIACNPASGGYEYYCAGYTSFPTWGDPTIVSGSLYMWWGREHIHPWVMVNDTEQCHPSWWQVNEEYFIHPNTPCPENTTFVGPHTGDCVPNGTPTDKNNGSPLQCVGNPCNPATGNIYQSEEDYRTIGGSFLLSRSYNSFLNPNTGLGNWLTPWHKRLEILSSSSIRIRRENGRGELFTMNATGFWQGDTDSVLVLVQDASGFTLAPRKLKGSEPFTARTLAITLPLARKVEQANAKETPVLSTRYPGSCRSAWS